MVYSPANELREGLGFKAWGLGLMCDGISALTLGLWHMSTALRREKARTGPQNTYSMIRGSNIFQVCHDTSF